MYYIYYFTGKHSFGGAIIALFFIFYKKRREKECHSLAKKIKQLNDKKTIIDTSTRTRRACFLCVFTFSNEKEKKKATFGPINYLCNAVLWSISSVRGALSSKGDEKQNVETSEMDRAIIIARNYIGINRNIALKFYIKTLIGQCASCVLSLYPGSNPPIYYR